MGCKVPTDLVKISVKEAMHMGFYHMVSLFFFQDFINNLISFRLSDKTDSSQMTKGMLIMAKPSHTSLLFHDRKWYINDRFIGF